MNGKGRKSMQLAVTIATALALSSAIAPAASAKSKSDAIIGTGVDAIIGTGIDAIIGTGRTKSASTDAIIGTGRGGKANAIIGTGADAIIGTGIDAIIGTGRTKSASTDAIIGTGVDAIIGTGRVKLLAFGPVDSVDPVARTIDVMGKSYALMSTERVAAEMAAGRQLTVSVTGVLGEKGSARSAALALLTTDYVAGASRVITTGKITAVDQSLGTLVIGKLVVDYSAVDLPRLPQVGDIAAVAGVQPSRGGTVFAERLGIR
jgi:hypothetical protein